MNHCPSFRGSDAFRGSDMYTKRYGYIIKHRREQKKVEYLKRIQSATAYINEKGKEIYIPPFLYIRNHPTKYIL